MRYAIPICCLIVYLLVSDPSKQAAQQHLSVVRVEEVKAEPIAESKPASTPFVEPVRATIKLYYSDNCTPCERWRLNEQPKYEKQGWKIEAIKANEGTTPRFEVCDGLFCFTHTGYMTVQQFTASMQQVRGK